MILPYTEERHFSNMKKITTLIILCALSIPALAQSKKGMHFENGTWVAPTPQSALDAFHMKSRRTESAVAVLRQTHSKHPKAEIDALADELTKIFREGDYGISASAAIVLEMAGQDQSEGIPYERAKHLFRSVYEEKAGTDFVMALRALHGVFY